MAELKKAKVIKTGKPVEVYKLQSGEWCDYEDCKTVYKRDELKF